MEDTALFLTTGLEQTTMASNENKNVANKLTMLEAKALIVKNKDSLTQEMKEAILEALSKDVHSNLAEARHLWAKKKPLTKEQSALLLEWMWTQVDHSKADSDKLVLIAKPKAVGPPISVFGATTMSRPYFGSPSTTFLFGADVKVCSTSLAGIVLLVWY